MTLKNKKNDMNAFKLESIVDARGIRWKVGDTVEFSKSKGVVSEVSLSEDDSVAVVSVSNSKGDVFVEYTLRNIMEICRVSPKLKKTTTL